MDKEEAFETDKHGKPIHQLKYTCIEKFLLQKNNWKIIDTPDTRTGKKLRRQILCKTERDHKRNSRFSNRR